MTAGRSQKKESWDCIPRLFLHIGERNMVAIDFIEIDAQIEKFTLIVK